MRLGQVIRKWRVMSELDLRTAADQMGLDHATLSRVETGKMPSAETLRTLLFWLIGNDRGE